jgi:hypothetical protein
LTNWYILYKKHDSAIATIVVTNLASNSGLACSGFYVTLYGVDGTGDAINSYGRADRQRQVAGARDARAARGALPSLEDAREAGRDGRGKCPSSGDQKVRQPLLRTAGVERVFLA